MPLELKSKLDLDRLMREPNLVPLLDEKDVQAIGAWAAAGYTQDLNSRVEWSTRQAQANKLALQVFEEKTFPWPGAASVKFPLITVAALQYHAKSYPALVSGTDLVKCRVIGLDPTGQKTARAARISTHMSWQNLEQDSGWEQDHSKLLLVQAIAGCAFKKRVYEPGHAKQSGRLVLPENMVVNYFATNLEDARRYTHTYYLNHNNIYQRELDGRFSPVETQPEARTGTEQEQQARDERQGITQPQKDDITPFFTGEQYCWIDLDGDGYEEPYIVTFDIATNAVRRIVARFLPGGVKKREEDVYKITPIKVFVKYGFIPSPDGGFYDLGLGSILGPLNETVNTTINQMLDAGTMATLGGGFLGRGFKGKGGAITFQPNQWYPVDAPGDDIRKNVLPLPVREPSQVLFQLLGLLLQYGERIVSATELQMGENIGQNTPAETARTMNENGARIYNALYKGTWLCMREEFRIQFELNSLYLDVDQDYTELTSGQGAMISAEDYVGPSLDVRPAADPHVVSDEQKIQQARIVFQNSLQVPGHNRYQATKRLYESMKIANIDQILPPPQGPGPDGKPQPLPDFPPMPNPKMMRAQLDQQEFQLEVARFKAEQQQTKIELQMEVQKNQAEIMKLYAQAEKFMAEAKGVDVGHQIAIVEAQIGALKTRNEGLLKALSIIQKETEGDKGGAKRPGMGAMGGTGADEGVPQVPGGNGAAGTAGLAQPAL